MKVFKYVLMFILIASTMALAGCGGDKIAGTWYGVDGDELHEFIIEKHNETYLMTATKYRFEKWYVPGEITENLDSNLVKEKIFYKQNITFKDDVISYPLPFGQSANLVYKDNAIRGNIYGSLSKNECIYKQNEKVKLDDLIKQLEETEMKRLAPKLTSSAKINFIVNKDIFKNNNTLPNG